MKSLARWSIDNRVPVNLLMVILVVGGLFSFRSIHREVFPLFALRIVTVVTSYPGVSPAELEQLVTVPVENAVAEVDGVSEIRSSTSEGLSVVVIEFEEHVDNVTIAAQDVESAVDTITTMPEDAEDPVIEELELEFPVIDVAVSGAADEAVRREVTKDLRRRMERIDGVSAVTPTGLRELEIWTELDPDELFALNMSLDLVLERLRRRLVNVPAGNLRTERGEVLLRTTGTTAETDRLESLVLRAGDDGHHVTLGDLGRVSATFEEAQTLARANGYPAILLHVVKQSGGDTIQIVEEVETLVEEFRSTAEPGVELFLINDGSIWIENRLRTMYQSGLWGLALVLLVLNLFLNPRVAAMTAFGLPLAVAGGLITLYLTGGSLNMLSLFAFILVLGILVDDAIIIAENAYRYMQRGQDPQEATITGTREVTMPVVAGVSTTIAAFLPLLLTSGVMGEFLKIVPIVAVACLVSSLVEALVILPSHLADFSRNLHVEPTRRRTPRWFRRLRRAYGHTVAAAVRHRYAVLGSILVAGVAAGLLTTVMPFVFFDDSAAVEARINIEAPASSALEDTEQIVEQVERISLSFPPSEIKSVVSRVGTQPSQNQRTLFGPNLGQVTVSLGEDEGRERSADEIFEGLRGRFDEVVGAESLELERQQGGPPVGRPVYVQVLGEDLETLRRIAGEVRQFLAGVDGVYDLSDSFDEGKDEVRVEIDEDRAALYGLSVESIGHAVRTAMDGTVVTTVQEEDEDIDVRVRYLPEARRTLADIASLRISTPDGRLVPFGNVAELRHTAGYSAIDRVGRERVIAVSADVDDDIITSVEANSRVSAHFSDIPQRYPGYHLDLGGEAQETEESLESLSQAFLVAFLVIYSILGTIFRSFSQPFVVLFAIPFSLVGVVFGFFVVGEALSFMSLFGVIALAGIVVNDSLLLVSFINDSRARGANPAYAVAISAKRRFRPVMLTSLSTIAGVLPLSLASSGQAAFLAPMAMAIVWGLGFSTVLTLLLVPALYMINLDIQGGLTRLITGEEEPDRRGERDSADVQDAVGAPATRASGS